MGQWGPTKQCLWQPLTTPWHCGNKYYIGKHHLHLYNVKILFPFQSCTVAWKLPKTKRLVILEVMWLSVSVSASICDLAALLSPPHLLVWTPKTDNRVVCPHGASILTCQTQNIQSSSRPYLKHSRTKAAQMASTLSIPPTSPFPNLSLFLSIWPLPSSIVSQQAWHSTPPSGVSFYLSFLRRLGFES